MKEIPSVLAFEPQSLSVMRKMIASGLNSPLTTSAGRLFDAVSSIIGIQQTVNFEGQGAMELEFAADGINSDENYAFEISGDRRRETGDRKYYEPLLVVNWKPMIKCILEDISDNMPVGVISARFHNTLVEIIVDMAKRVGMERVLLTGGCFQNKYLTERAIERLTNDGFKAYWHQRVPPNDGGISLGQLFVALKRNKGRRDKKLEIRNQK